MVDKEIMHIAIFRNHQ